jgi:hypothetical protein
MPSPDVRKGMPPRQLDRATFDQRFKSRFVDPVFAPLQKEVQAIMDAAWDAYDDSRKAPITARLDRISSIQITICQWIGLLHAEPFRKLKNVTTIPMANVAF